MADEVPEFYCRSWSGFSTRWVAYVDCDKDYKDKFELLGPVSINGKPYRCTGVLISVMNHRKAQQLFKSERIGLEVESHDPQKLNRPI
jgi:hypothetical protein